MSPQGVNWPQWVKNAYSVHPKNKTCFCGLLYMFVVSNWSILSISFRVTLLPLGWSYDLSVCSTACSSLQKENPVHCPFLTAIHQWPVDSPHQSPVMWKDLSCHHLIMWDECGVQFMVSYNRLWCYDANMINSYCCDISVVAVVLTRWGRVTHIYVGKLTIIGSDNGLSPGGRQAIIRTNAGISLIGPLGTNFSEILIEILTFSFKKMRLKV